MSILSRIKALWNGDRPKPIVLKVGEKAPQELLDRKSDKPIGGFIKVCPECDRIDAIFHP